MDNQHRQIKGYRDLTAEEIAAMNRIKEAGAMLESLVQSIQADPNVKSDGRWLAIGVTDLQKGLMGLTRAVAKPDFF